MWAAEPEVMSMKEALRKHVLVAAARPDYPNERQFRPTPGSIYSLHLVTGSGLFDLKFNYESGQLREIQFVQSTGNPMLDGRSIAVSSCGKQSRTPFIPSAFLSRSLRASRSDVKWSKGRGETRRTSYP